MKIENCLFSIFNFESKLRHTKMSFSIPILKWILNGTFSARIKNGKKFFWIYFDLKSISKNKNRNFRIHFLISNQKLNFRKFFHFPILVMKLKNEKWKIFKICFVLKSKNELYFRYTDWNPCTESIICFLI